VEKNVLSIDCDWIQHSTQMVELNNLVFQTFKSVDRIFFLKNHYTIVKYIDTPSYICNVDHHHDINYGYNNQHINTGNWVSYLIEKGLVEKYTWIHNVNSKYNVDEVVNQIGKLKEYNLDLDLNYIKNIQFQDIFICESFGFYENLNDDEKKFFIPYNIFKQVAFHFFKEKVIIDNEKNNGFFLQENLEKQK